MKNSTQNIRDEEKKTPQTPQTRKCGAKDANNGTLYFQIGLIITLLLCIFLMEYKSSATRYETESLAVEKVYHLNDWNENFRLEPKKQTPPADKKEVSKSLPPQEVPDNTEIFEPEDLLPASSTNTDEEFTPDDIVEVSKEEPTEEVSFDAVEFVPVYPGCENLGSNQARKTCLQENLKELITKNFDTDRVQDFANRGVNRINVQFTVDENGRVTDIKTRAANEQLEQEARRVINKIPQMKPGMKKGKKVKVYYGQPILFKIDN